MERSFRDDLTALLNSRCCENGSDTPDFILAEYLFNCLDAFDAATVARERWYGRTVGGGGAIVAHITRGVSEGGVG